MKPQTRGALLMLCSACLYGMMTVATKLSSSSMSAFEIAFFRNFFGLVVVLPLSFADGRGIVRAMPQWRYLERCITGVLAMFCSCWAIGHLPLAQAIALAYSTPLFAALGALVFLRERVGVARWSAVVLGFSGVLMVVRPGAVGFDAGILVALSGAVLLAFVSIQIKRLLRTEPGDRIVAVTTLYWVPLSLGPALFTWTWPHGIVWLWASAVGVLGTAAHLLWVRAMRLGEVSVLTPISFVQLPIALTIGFFAMGEKVDRYTMIGTAIMLAANAGLVRHGARPSPRDTSLPR